MDIVILDSAYKYEITEESILSCLYNLRGDEVLDDPPLKSLWAGFDYLGNAFEIITVEEDEQRLVVIHAMRLRKQFYYLLEGN